jgi:hypothetical protein
MPVGVQRLCVASSKVVTAGVFPERAGWSHLAVDAEVGLVVFPRAGVVLGSGGRSFVR